jgi:hypothetical protein
MDKSNYAFLHTTYANHMCSNDATMFPWNYTEITMANDGT